MVDIVQKDIARSSSVGKESRCDMTVKDKEIEILKEEKFRYENTIEKFRMDFQIFNEKIKKLESDVESKNCQIEEMQKHIDCLKADLAEAQDNEYKLPSEPIKVAEMLIYAKGRRKTNGFERAFSNTPDIVYYDIYSKSDLRQIADHLLVYCNNSEDE